MGNEWRLEPFPPFLFTRPAPFLLSTWPLSSPSGPLLPFPPQDDSAPLSLCSLLPPPAPDLTRPGSGLSFSAGTAFLPPQPPLDDSLIADTSGSLWEATGVVCPPMLG